MRLMYIINNLKLGGAEKRVVDLINGLGPQFSLGLACLQCSGELLEDIQREDISVYDLGVRDRHDLLDGVERLMGVLDSFNPQILHTHLVQASLLGRIAALSAKIPVITTQHHAYHVKDYSPLYRIERSTWILSHGFIALSIAIKRQIRSLGYRGPVRVIRTGITPSDFAPTSTQEATSEPYILSVGQFRDMQKGHDLLVKSFRRVVDKFPNYKLYLVGDGPERAKVEELAYSLGLDSSVKFLGERHDVLELMAKSSLFVLASRWEGFGRVLLEAMSMGCAIIATSTEGIPEIISNEQNGLLVKTEDALGLSNSIIRLLTDGDLRRRLGGAGKQTARRKFPVSKMLKQETEFYNFILNSRK